MRAEEIKARVSIEQVVAHYGGHLNGKGLGRCLCPERHHHNDADPSMSVKDGRVMCWSQGCFSDKGADIFELVGVMERLHTFPEQKARVCEMFGLNGQAVNKKIVATYDYVDESGALLFQTVRYLPKDFRQRRPDGHRGWIWDLKDTRLVPYNLPRLLPATHIFHPEGEKDCETADQLGWPDAGWAPTCNPMGAEKWRDEYSALLRGKTVVILPDADEAGEKHLAKTAASLQRYDCEVLVVRLPDGYRDLTEWANAIGTQKDFWRLLAHATPWEPANDAAPSEEEDAPRAEAPASFALTEVGNAEYFAAQYGDRVRYDHRRGRWLVWQAHRWVPDADAEIHRLAKHAIRQRLSDAATYEDDDKRTRAAKWALASESRSRLEALLALAQAEQPLADAGDKWDVDPWLLGVPNGVIDLRTGELRDGRREDRLTMSASVAFDPRASCSRWERFLLEIFNGDTELVAFIQKAIGYSLTGDTSEQCLFLNHGTGANGKGSLLNTFMWTVGDYAYNMPFSTIELQHRTSIPNDVAALVGRRFVVASETNDGTRLNESRVKALTGCDPLTARFLHGEFFTFNPVAKFWLAVNHKPIVRDDSNGFWRRIRLIPFTQRFAVNPSLAEELRAEGGGILAWAVRGCLAWQAHGLNPPASVLAATKEYEQESDPLGDFLHEACELSPEATDRATKLFAGYTGWAEARGLNDKERLTSTMFGRKMGERFPHDKDESGKFYTGVRRKVD